jgi:ABC-type branched-subunit amino acid transport system substrate-binding protein
VRRLAALVAAAAGGTGAAPASEQSVTPTSVLLRGTVPLTGEAAAFGAVGPGARAYFDHVNAQGGAHGRKILYRYDDEQWVRASGPLHARG